MIRTILMQESRFDSYVDAARNGKNALWRIALGIVLIAIVWIAATFAAVFAGMAVVMIRDGQAPTRLDRTAAASDLGALFGDPIGALVTLLSIGSLWPAVWLVLKIVHKRSIRDLFGIDRRLHWSDFARGAIVTMVVSIVTLPIALLIDPTFVRGSISVSNWLATAPLLILALLLQTAAEEIAFRGYLQQALAARFATPFIWLALPAGAFTLLHWDGQASTAMNLAILFILLGFSLSMTFLLMASGNLGAAMGAHFGNNIVALLLFSYQPNFGRISLFEGRSFADQDWTPAQAVALGVYAILTIAVTQALLLHRASPVRLRSLS